MNINIYRRGKRRGNQERVGQRGVPRGHVLKRCKTNKKEEFRYVHEFDNQKKIAGDL